MEFIASSATYETGLSFFAIFSRIAALSLFRSLLAEVFGQDNDCALITFKKTSGAGSFAGGTTLMAAVSDYIIWFAKDKTKCKYRQPYLAKEIGGLGAEAYTQIEDEFGGRRRASIQEIESGIGDGRFFRPLIIEVSYPVKVDGKPIRLACPDFKRQTELFYKENQQLTFAIMMTLRLFL
jgi:hypothetical protein